MNAARHTTSARLKRVLKVLRDGQPHSTRDIARAARVMAVSACIAELRANGAEITCTRQKTEQGLIWNYTMTKGPKVDET